jgi:alkylation response protein AidB-like acyl-CoA dehydrogenase
MEATARYHPGHDQFELADALDSSLGDLLPLARLHVSQAETAETWASLSDLGLFGLGLSEERGGSGLGAAEEALIVMGLGRRLAAPAVLATMGAALALPDVRADDVGRTMPAYRHNGRIVLVSEVDAGLILLREEDGASLFKASTSNQVIDDRNWLADLREIADAGEPIVRFTPSQLLRLRLIDAAALAGMAQTAVEMGLAYAGFREQFGRPIGSFQAVKHHCANMAIAARCARDQVSFAAVAVDDERTDAALQVECALFTAGTAAIENAGTNIQIHGGIGFSDEADPHLLLKRARLHLAIAGGLEASNARIAGIAPIW